MTSKEREIRERAYTLWVEGGRQHGAAERDWLQAERDVAGAGTADAVSPVARSETARAEKASGLGKTGEPKPGASAATRAEGASRGKAAEPAGKPPKGKTKTSGDKEAAKPAGTRTGKGG